MPEEKQLKLRLKTENGRNVVLGERIGVSVRRVHIALSAAPAGFRNGATTIRRVFLH